MKHNISLLAALFLSTPLLADTLPERADEIVAYQISVRLDAATKQLDGREHITWRNPSTESVSDLWFHLYLNAFKNTKSTFFHESGGQLRGDRFADGKWGWTHVRSLRLSDGTDLTSSMRYVHPDDDNADDQTVVQVPLPRPVPPGGTIALDITFLAQLPQVFARTGYRHDYFLVGQWFPKLGVYETAGLRGRKTGGWNCHQFHATSEFYADYGRFKVDITLPARFVVGATGQRTGRATNPDGTISYTYEQDNVHDFAWTASPHFVEVKRRFRADEQVSREEQATTAQLLGRTPDEVRLSDVEVTLLLQPGHMPQLERHMGAAMAGLKYFGLWYGRYPYQTLTVVDPGPGASGSGGMEYPTFITAGTSLLLNHWPFDGLRFPEMVTVHEFGHQFWYGMVGNNEFEEAWLDEGFNSYSTGRILELLYGKDSTLIEFLGMRLGEIDSIRLENSPNMKFNAILNFAWKYTPLGAYGFYSYRKPELVLRTLENYLGERVMARVMRTYHERWRFRHPSSEDFFRVAQEVSGRDLSGYFDQTVRGSDILDYEIASVSTTKIPVQYGVFEKDGKWTTISLKDAEKQAKADEKKKVAPLYESVVVVRRRGEVIFPVDIDLKFEGRAPIRQQWDGRDRTITYRITRPERLEWANVDPERKVLLDVDWLNNSRRVGHDRKVGTSYSTTWMFWLQNVLALIGM